MCPCGEAQVPKKRLISSMRQVAVRRNHSVIAMARSAMRSRAESFSVALFS